MMKPLYLLCALVLAGCAGHAKPGTLHYPAHAWNLHVGGESTIMYNIDNDGSTSDVHMLSEQPTGFFSLTAIHDIQSWRYPPNHPRKHIIVNIKYVLPQVKYAVPSTKPSWNDIH